MPCSGYGSGSYELRIRVRARCRPKTVAAVGDGCTPGASASGQNPNCWRASIPAGAPPRTEYRSMPGGDKPAEDGSWLGDALALPADLVPVAFHSIFQLAAVRGSETVTVSFERPIPSSKRLPQWSGEVSRAGGHSPGSFTPCTVPPSGGHPQPVVFLVRRNAIRRCLPTSSVPVALSSRDQARFAGQMRP
jgi:hypothetical protein